MEGWTKGSHTKPQRDCGEQTKSDMFFVPFDQKFWYYMETWDEDSDFLHLRGFEWPAPYKIGF